MTTGLRSRAWLSIGAAVVILVIGLLGVACGGSGAAGPEQTVKQILAAIENKDIDAFWETVDPQFYEVGIAMGMTEEAMKAMVAGEALSDSTSMRFSNIELATEISDDGQMATVTVVGGQVTTVENGQTTTEDVNDSDEPKVFDLVLRDGKWYWDISALDDTDDTATEEQVTITTSDTGSADQPSSESDWTTVVKLESTDSPWQGMEGMLVSEPFTVSGEARLVLDMIDTGDFVVGVLLWIIPADLVPAADDPMGWADAVQDNTAVDMTMVAASPTKEVPGLDGTYVLYVTSYEGQPAWSLELQAP